MLCHGTARYTAFRADQRSPLLQALSKACARLGIRLPLGPELGSAQAAGAAVVPLSPLPSLAAFDELRGGGGEAGELLLECDVLALEADDDDLLALEPRPSAPRSLTLSRTSLTERRPGGGFACVRPLSLVHALSREPADAEAFAVHDCGGAVRRYRCGAPLRDTLLASILEVSPRA